MTDDDYRPDVLADWRFRLFANARKNLKSIDMVDDSTNKTYQLQVIDSKMTMSEVTNE